MFSKKTWQGHLRLSASVTVMEANEKTVYKNERFGLYVTMNLSQQPHFKDKKFFSNTGGSFSINHQCCY